MPKYIVNTNPNADGFNVVHVYPDPGNHDGYPADHSWTTVGTFESWREAVAEAESIKRIDRVRPCKRCCPNVVGADL